MITIETIQAIISSLSKCNLIDDLQDKTSLEMGNLFFVKNPSEYIKILPGMGLKPHYTHGYEFLKDLGFGETLRID